MGGIKFQFFIKFVVLLFVCTAFASCSEEDKFGIGLERPEDASLIERDKKVLRKLRSESFEEMKERLKSSIFYRVIANYEHKNRKTGEVEEVRFDFVAMCGGRVLMDAKGYTVSQTDGVNPAHFLKATSDDGVIMMRVPSACRSGQFVKKIPDDFTPFIVWFDNAHKIGHGLGYATEVAYQSPVSQLKFLGASLEQTDLTAWLEWRESQKKKFIPVGFIKSPWGVSLNGNEPENGRHFVDEHSTFSGLLVCQGQRRIELTAEAQNLLNNFWPEARPNFWIDQDADFESETLARKIPENNEYGGRNFWFGKLNAYRHGITTKRGTGRLYTESEYRRSVGEIFPKFLIKSRNTKQGEIPKKNSITIISHIDYRPSMRGFVACGVMRYPIDVKAKELGFNHGLGFYVNNQLVWGKKDRSNSKLPFSYFLEKNTHLWRSEF